MPDMSTPNQPDHLPETAEGPKASDAFTDLARKLLAVPRAEYEEELQAVEAGKPLRHDFNPRPGTGRPRTAKQ
jgi:hypothetical protein